MKKQILFIQGGGVNGYEADKELVKSIATRLGTAFDIYYPEIVPEMESVDFGWLQQLEIILDKMDNSTLIIAHSFGASMILKYLSENATNKKIKGLLLLSTPFWKSDEDWQKGFVLNHGFADKIPEELPVIFYHCRDDREVPFEQFLQYQEEFHRAVFRPIEKGGHQFSNDLTAVVEDIQAL